MGLFGVSRQIAQTEPPLAARDERFNCNRTESMEENKLVNVTTGPLPSWPNRRHLSKQSKTCLKLTSIEMLMPMAIHEIQSRTRTGLYRDHVLESRLSKCSVDHPYCDPALNVTFSSILHRATLIHSYACTRQGTLVHASQAPEPVLKGLCPNDTSISPRLPISDAEGLIRRARVSLHHQGYHDIVVHSFIHAGTALVTCGCYIDFISPFLFLNSSLRPALEWLGADAHHLGSPLLSHLITVTNLATAPLPTWPS